MPRRRNLWVIDRLQWRWKARFQVFASVASCVYNQFALPGKRFHLRRRARGTLILQLANVQCDTDERGSASRESAIRTAVP